MLERETIFFAFNNHIYFVSFRLSSGLFPFLWISPSLPLFDRTSSHCLACQQKQYLCLLVQKLCMSSEKHWQAQYLFNICNHLMLFLFCEENSLVEVLNSAPNMCRTTQEEGYHLNHGLARCW